MKSRYLFGKRFGFTLVELLVVVAVLTIVAGLVVVRLSGMRDYASRKATLVSMAHVRDAVLGHDNVPGYLGDMRQLPTSMTDLLEQGSQPKFDPNTGKGWRGPYIQNAMQKLNPDGTYSPLSVFDGWMNPILIQVPLDTSGNFVFKYARLVSAGQDGTIQTQSSDQEAIVRGDDIVFFFNRDAGVDTPDEPEKSE